MAQTVELEVTGTQQIHCAGCETRIGNVLRRLAGVEDVQASTQDQRVVVRYDPAQVGADQVRAKLAQLGCETTT